MIDWADRDFGGPQPPREIIDKWERAVKENDPFILTTEDHLRMLRRWPLDEANRFCRHYVGLTIDQLVQKAADTTDLSEAEAIIVLNTPFGDSTPDEQKEMTNQGRWSRNTRKKFHDALDLIISRVETEKKARENAGVTLEKIKSIRKPELQNFTRDDLRNITGCNKIPWVRELEKHLEHEPAWGFVCLRTTFGDDLAWNRFKEFLIHATESALVFPRNFSSIRSRWKIQWIEDPSVQDLSVIELCRYFRALCDAGKVESGLRQDAFLYANSESIDSVIASPVLPSSAFIMAAEADYDGIVKDEVPPLGYRDYPGSVRIAIPHVYTTFYARLKFTEEISQERKSRLRYNLKEVYAKAEIPNEKIYPVKYFFMGT